MSEERGWVPIVLLAFLLGGIVGAGLTFFFAPASGTEARGRVRDVASEVRKRAEGAIEEIRGASPEFPSVP